MSKRNYNFSIQFNMLVNEITSLRGQKIVLYGYGLIGKLAHALLKNDVMGILDQNADRLDQNELGCPVKKPFDCNGWDFDIILITVLGREDEIIQMLITTDGLSSSMIKTLDFLVPKLFKEETNENTFLIGNIKLSGNMNDKGFCLYDSKSSYEEINSRMYHEIQKKFMPDCIIDIGANYGFTGCLFAKVFPKAHIVAIEADQNLCHFIQKNFEQNHVNGGVIINAICADKDDRVKSFSLNPSWSQDNRVQGADTSWKQIEVKTITLDRIISLYHGNFCFIKIDTQGYEEYIFKGGESFLNSSSNWIIKMEFAPQWLTWQNTDPEIFLEYLITRYTVCELPSRFTCKDSLEDICFNKVLQKHEIKQFISYIRAYHKNGLGACELIVAPKNLIV